MILKCKSIAHIRNSIGYILKDEKEHQLISYDGINIESKKSILSDFGMYQKEKVKNGFVSLVISPSPDKKLDDKDFQKLVQSTLIELKLENRQYIAVTHHNTKTPHCHVILNRIDYNENTWDDHHIAWKCKSASEKVALEHGLTSAKQIELQRAVLKKELRDITRDALYISLDLSDFDKKLESVHIKRTLLERKNGTYGVTFLFKGYEFKASEIDRILSLKPGKEGPIVHEKIQERFDKNQILKNENKLLLNNMTAINKEIVLEICHEMMLRSTNLSEFRQNMEGAGIKLKYHKGRKGDTQFLVTYNGQNCLSDDISLFLTNVNRNGNFQIHPKTLETFEKNRRRGKNIRTIQHVMKDYSENREGEFAKYFERELKSFSKLFDEVNFKKGGLTRDEFLDELRWAKKERRPHEPKI